MNFDAKMQTDGIIDFIRNYYQENKLGGVILGISGGKDSAVVAALFVKALGSENVIGVTIPCFSIEEDKIDAKVISDYYGFELINFDLTEIFQTFKKELQKLGDFKDENLKNSDINLKPRLRMVTLYYLAALYSSLRNKTYLVAGTSNKSELYVGYFTKGGDSVHDIATIADFTKEEVIAIGEYLQVPKKILYKVPNDGLSNQNDEEKLGVKYLEISSYMKDKKSVKEDVAKRIEYLHNTNLHKFYIPTYKKKRRIGIFGGSFNPPHKMHQEISLNLIKEGYVDYVIYVPTESDYYNKNIIPGNHRYQMVKMMMKDNKYLLISDYELKNKTYTYETLNYFQKKYPNDEIYFICGSDSLEKIHTWKKYQEILINNKLLIIKRDDNIDILLNKYHEYKDNIIITNIIENDISSTLIRKKIKEKDFDNLYKLLDKDVLDYIIENKLY